MAKRKSIVDILDQVRYTCECGWTGKYEDMPPGRNWKCPECGAGYPHIRNNLRDLERTIRPRKPPDLPFQHAPDGICRLCGDPTTEPRRKKWHSECADEANVAWNPSHARRIVFHRDKGACAGCGQKQSYRKPRTFQIDHKRPLWANPDDFSAWLAPNLQILCNDCHMKKTVKEAAERAELRRQSAIILSYEQLPICSRIQEDSA